MEDKKINKVFLLVLFVIASMDIFGETPKNNLKEIVCKIKCDTSVRGYFYVSYDTMELQLNKALKKTDVFKAKSQNKDISAGALIKVGIGGRIRKVKCIDYPSSMSNADKLIHQEVVSNYFKSLKRVKYKLPTTDGKCIKTKEIIVWFMIDACGYIKINNSNSFKDQDINLLECPFST
jgi:hypothetical protein